MSISALPKGGTLPSARGFVPALESMRAVAALAVLVTHVAFQIGESTGSPINRIIGRFDLAVALFFALSGFLLWRRSAARARSATPDKPSVRTYLERRLIRVMPAYLAVTIVTLAFLPANSDVGFVTWFANLTLTQIYIPDTLTAGLTHAWSLAVELAFYLTLPLLWIAMTPLRGDAARWRIPVIAGVGVLSLGWALLPWEALGLPEGINDQILPPAFASWFAGGMVLAELVAARPGRLAALASRPASKWGWWAAAALCFLITTHPDWFTEGFVHPSGAEFAVRTGLGALTAFLLLGPIILSPDHLGGFNFLNSTVMTALGRWSYGIFLWHVVVLYYSFEILDIPMFSGQFWPVFLVTLVLSVAAGAVSFALVEEPSRTAYDQRFRPCRAASRAAEEARAKEEART